MSSVEKKAGSRRDFPLLAELYQRLILDPLVEIAHAVAHDFVRRPRRYGEVPEKTAGLLAGFRGRTGSDPEWPSAMQRSALFGAVTGHAFCAGSIGLWNAARVFLESPAATKPRAQFIRDEALTFRATLTTMRGPGLSAIDRHTAALFANAVEVFRSEPIAHAFGLRPARGGDWPFHLELCGDSAYLLERISRTLRLWTAGLPMTQRRFLLLQRAAHYGAATIAAVMEDGKEGGGADDGESLAANAGGWETAMRGLFLKVDVLKAWKDPDYRECLCEAERALLPDHPAGAIDLTDTELDSLGARMQRLGLRFQTQTVGDAICCCTGDLPCGQTSEGGYCNPTNVGFTCPVTDCGSGCTILT